MDQTFATKTYPSLSNSFYSLMLNYNIDISLESVQETSIIFQDFKKEKIS